MTVHSDIRGMAVARRVLHDPRSSDRALRAALADMLRIVASMRAEWMAETAERRIAQQAMAEIVAEWAKHDLATYRKPKQGQQRRALRLVEGGRR